MIVDPHRAPFQRCGFGFDMCVSCEVEIFLASSCISFQVWWWMRFNDEWPTLCWVIWCNFRVVCCALKLHLTAAAAFYVVWVSLLLCCVEQDVFICACTLWPCMWLRLVLLLVRDMCSEQRVCSLWSLVTVYACFVLCCHPACPCARMARCAACLRHYALCHFFFAEILRLCLCTRCASVRMHERACVLVCLCVRVCVLFCSCVAWVFCSLRFHFSPLCSIQHEVGFCWNLWACFADDGFTVRKGIKKLCWT